VSRRQEAEGGKQELKIENLRTERNLKPETENPRPTTRHPMPDTRHPILIPKRWATFKRPLRGRNWPPLEMAWYLDSASESAALIWKVARASRPWAHAQDARATSSGDPRAQLSRHHLHKKCRDV